jgi:hypothetical protein
MLKLSWRRGASVSAALAVVLAGTVVVPTVMAQANKEFDQAVTVATAFDRGTVRATTFTIENTSRNRISFSAANMYVAGITYVGSESYTPTVTTPTATTPASVTQPAGAVVRWVPVETDDGVDTGVLEFRNLEVPRNATVSVTIPFRIPCANQGATNPTVRAEIRQSNTFNGPDNTFIPKTNDTTTITPIGQCQLKFTGQPADADVDAVITSEAKNPEGDPVTVRALDSKGAFISWYAGDIALSITGGATLETVTADEGIAEFAPKIGTVGNYTVDAASTNFLTKTSTSFRVGPPITFECEAEDYAPCATDPIEGSGGEKAVIEVNDFDGLDATLTAEFVAASYDCEAVGYAPTALSAQLSFDIRSENDLTGLTKTVTYKLPLEETAPGVYRTDATTYQVCFQAPYDFPAINNNEDPLEDLSSGIFLGNTIYDGSTYTGLLLMCSYGTALGIKTGVRPVLDDPDTTDVDESVEGVEQDPCIVSRIVDNVNKTITIKVTLKAADPAMRAG